MTIGIYKITNRINGKCYIGQSISIEDRWKKHVSQFNNKAYSSVRLYKAFKKYGVESFSFEVLEECDRESLNELEIAYIAKYRSYQEGYNMTLGGNGLGRAFSEEHRRKLSISHMGHKQSPEANRKRSESLRCALASEEAKKRMGDLRRGKARPEEVRRKISEKHKGKKLSDDHKRKLSESHKGHKPSKETCQKIREAHLGANSWKARTVRCNGVIYPTAKQCAESIVVSRATLSRWLNGHAKPNGKHADLIRELYFVDEKPISALASIGQ